MTNHNHFLTGYHLDNNTGYYIDLVTRQITFQYSINNDTDDEIGFDFTLLCECRDDKQVEIKAMLAEEGILIATKETEDDFLTFVTNAPILENFWETE